MRAMRGWWLPRQLALWSWTQTAWDAAILPGGPVGAVAAACVRTASTGGIPAPLVVRCTRCSLPPNTWMRTHEWMWTHEGQVCSRGLISYAAQALVILVAAVGVEGHAQ